MKRVWDKGILRQSVATHTVQSYEETTRLYYRMIPALAELNFPAHYSATVRVSTALIPN